nr:hypothetical protein JVH1_6442 [Rhodococcus sp. JVH1]
MKGIREFGEASRRVRHRGSELSRSHPLPPRETLPKKPITVQEQYR